jgi:hypothetical protein
MDFTRVSSNGSVEMAVAIIPAGERGIRDILGALELQAHMSAKHLSNKSERRFRGSGQWWLTKTSNDRFEVSVDVGCWCEHDCCGHVCSCSFDLIRRTSDWVIVIETRRNV